MMNSSSSEETTVDEASVYMTTLDFTAILERYSKIWLILLIEFSENYVALQIAEVKWWHLS